MTGLYIAIGFAVVSGLLYLGVTYIFNPRGFDSIKKKIKGKL